MTKKKRAPESRLRIDVISARQSYRHFSIYGVTLAREKNDWTKRLREVSRKQKLQRLKHVGVDETPVKQMVWKKNSNYHA